MHRARIASRTSRSAALVVVGWIGLAIGAGRAVAAEDSNPPNPGGGLPGYLEELLEARVTGGYVMTHEHPTAGMAFGGNYAYAGTTSNYQNGIPENAYGSCGGCASGTCSHGETKGNLVPFGPDMGNHSSHAGPYHDSFSHLQYSSEWIKEAFDPAGTLYDDARMKIFVAFAVENEAMCELLYYENQGGGGAGGAGYPCTKGDSKASLERQINNIKNWAAAHSSWAEIAYTAADARRIANANKLVVILGVEAEYAFGAEDRVFDVVTRLEAYHAMGVRTFYLAHKLNSRLSGADVYYPKDSSKGLMFRTLQAVSGCFYYDDHVANFPLVDGGFNYCNNETKCGDDAIKGSKLTDGCNHKLSEISETNMLIWLGMGAGSFNGFDIYPKPPGFTGSGGTTTVNGVERNDLGLSTDGERVIRRAMELGMIVNIDHVSSVARGQIYDIAMNEFGGYPLNALHNNPNEKLVGSRSLPLNDVDTPYPHEYDFDKVERDYIRTTGGIFGVRLGPLDSSGYAASGITLDCPKTSTENAKILAYLLDEELNVGYSLDFASGTEGVHGRDHEGKCTSLGKDWLEFYGTQLTKGLAHIGMMKYWHKELEEVGLAQTYLDQLKNDGAEAFIDMWENSEDRALP